MAVVTLVLASGPGFPDGSADHRYEVELALDAGGHPDAAAWAADPAPWRARRLWPGSAVLEGDVQHDPDTGWSVTFFGADADRPDAPLHGLIRSIAQVRPGEYVTIREPDGVEYSYRVVSLG